MGTVLLLLALLLLLAAAVLLGLSRRGRVEAGLPQGRVVYADSRAWRRPEAPLRSPRYGLVGRPDYLLRRGRHIIPVEAKPSRAAAAPYVTDLLQLAAYCLLVEETYGVRPPHGLLVYRRRTFEVPFDAAMRDQLLHALQEMEAAYDQDDVPRSHDQPGRCARCSMRRHCGEEALC